MNNKPSINYLLLIIIPMVFSCYEPVKEDNKKNLPASSPALHVKNKKYMLIDTKASFLTWQGASLNGLINTQTGYIYISNGELMVENGQVKSGTIEVGMNTIEDKNHGSDNKLVNHLKDPDFFDTKRFPFSTIVITGVALVNGEDRKVTGDLTIKGITHAVTFPAKIKVKNGMVTANAQLVIDRTKWDVRYKSAKFYNNLANQTMSDSIKFYIHIIAKKQTPDLR
ncbi:YceI family protein [Mucilaginibacter galii]|uniref:Lipid/polyisoprenoid-binding YceI-like domain-containing protein n=2 Tax=Mucilaginibacter galii TaxID=2005073 RepID=A0A917N089_9SPHI|nr:hypothetical protein GCM10011425_08680 [Mucilaginibacter galii]